MLRKIKDFFIVNFNSEFKFFGRPYNKQWNRKLKRLLRDNIFTNITEHTADLGEVKIWIANYPYTTFHEYFNIRSTNQQREEFRPSKMTILKAKRKLDADIQSQYKRYEVIRISKDQIDRHYLTEQLQEYIYDFTDNGFKYKLEATSHLKNVNLILKLSSVDKNFKNSEVMIINDYLTIIDRLKDKYVVKEHSLTFDSKFTKIEIFLDYSVVTND